VDHDPENPGTPHSLMLKMTAFFSRRYTLPGIFQLFLVTAFPIHVWALLLAFGDVSWVAARTNAWDAVGLVSYAMFYALLETIAISLIVLILGFLLPASWGVERRVGLLGTLFLTLALWAILGQLFFMFDYHFPAWMIDFLVRSSHPVRVIWGIEMPMVSLSFLLPAALLTRSKKAQNAVSEIFGRIVVLSSFYLVLDVAGIVVIALRNI
jgi:hypothetical protein